MMVINHVRKHKNLQFNTITPSKSEITTAYKSVILINKYKK